VGGEGKDDRDDVPEDDPAVESIAAVLSPGDGASGAEATVAWPQRAGATPRARQARRAYQADTPNRSIAFTGWSAASMGIEARNWGSVVWTMYRTSIAKAIRPRRGQPRRAVSRTARLASLTAV
jgi:hypothetical protein